MGLRHGRNIQVYINGVDLTGSLNEVNPVSEQELADVSTFGTQGHCFYPGLAKDSGTIVGLYDDTERAVFEGMIQISPSYAMMLAFGGTIGAPAYATKEIMLKSNNIKSVVTDVNRISFGFDVDNYPFEECKLLTAGIQTAGSTGYAVVNDNGSSNTTGGAGYLQVFYPTTGSIAMVQAVIVTSSSNAWLGEQVTTCIFALASTSGAERIAISGIIERYARSQWTIYNSTCKFAIALKRY